MDFEFEIRAGHPSFHVAGVDEVGRGCLAGPVVAAAVIPGAVLNFELDPWLSKINDSKLVKSEVREQLAPLIRGWAIAYAVGTASVEEIDQINIYHAAHLAMKRAIEALPIKPAHVLIDGNALPKALSCAATAIVKGDSKVISIAAASILAKVWRDERMKELESQFPGYGLATHKGYSTPQHVKALREKGVTIAHRKSFGPVAALLSLRPSLF